MYFQFNGFLKAGIQEFGYTNGASTATILHAPLELAQLYL